VCVVVVEYRQYSEVVSLTPNAPQVVVDACLVWSTAEDSKVWRLEMRMDVHAEAEQASPEGVRGVGRGEM